jgi:hypothetical protein
VTVFVDPSVRFGRDTVEGLRISSEKPRAEKPELQPNTNAWRNAVEAFARDGNLNAVEKRMTISDKNKDLIVKEVL